MSTKTHILKLVLLKFIFRHLVNIHGWSNIEKQRLTADLKVKVQIELTKAKPSAFFQSCISTTKDIRKFVLFED